MKMDFFIRRVLSENLILEAHIAALINELQLNIGMNHSTTFQVELAMRRTDLQE